MSRLLSSLLPRFATTRRRCGPKPRRPRSSANARLRSARLGIEALEARLVPTGFTPSQMRHAYGLDRVGFEDSSHSLVAGDGAGQTIGIVDAYDDPNIAGDLSYFDSYYGLPAPPSFTKVNQTGGTSYPPPNTGWAQEIALDVEWAHVMAPGASIMLVEANSNSYSDLLTAVQYAANHGASEISMSFSGPEWSGETGYDSDFTHSNVTYFASTGDGGVPAGYPAYSPNVVAVGGTSLYLDRGNYSSESGWSGSGGGISAYESQPSYQNGVVTQSTTRRTAPDISMDADPATGAWVYNTYQSGGWGVWGGTSLSSPLMAGVAAVVNQGSSYLFNGHPSYSGPNFLNALYHLPQSDINDITAGNNGYPAGPGYDLVTGRGTPSVDRFVAGMVGAPVYNPVTGELLVTGGAHNSTDTFTLSQNSSGQLVVQVTTSIPLPGSGNPSSQTFTYNSGQIGLVTICTSDGSGSTTVNIQNSTGVRVNLEDHDNTTVNVGTAHNGVGVLETSSGAATTINGSSTMTVNVGNNGNVQDILGPLTITNPSSSTRVIIDDSADPTGRNVTIGSGGVTGIAPAAINFNTGSVNTLWVIVGGGSDNTVTLAGAPASSITLLGGGSGTNTLRGPDTANIWNVTGTNAGTLDGTVTFSGFQNLTGGSGNDVFTFSDGASLSGTLNGGGGSNTLSYSAYSTPVTVNLAASTATGVGGFSNIQNFVGSPGGGNTLIGPNANTTWNLTGSNAGNLGGGTTFANFANLTGGSGADTFVFANGAGVSGNLDGGAGNNMLDYLAYTTSVAVDLTAGTATGVGGSVANIQELRGGQGNDTLNGNSAGTTIFFASPGNDTVTGAGGTNTLVGTSAASTWSVTAQNGGTLTFGTSTTTFSGVQNLTGGAAADTFILSNGVGIDGNLDGGGGSNTLNLGAYTSGVTVDLTAATAAGVGGTIANLQSFVGGSASNTLKGPSANTTWTITGSNAGTLSGGFSFSAFGTLNGGAGTNTLIGPNAAAAWHVSAQNGGTLTFGSATMTFTGMQNLTGGSAADAFLFDDGVGIDGNLDGGGGGNTLNYSAYSTPVTVDLAANAATGVGGLSNIQNFVGSPGGGNTLLGPNAPTTWNVTGHNTGSLTGGFSFTAFQNLTGGAAADSFVLSNGAGVDGIIDGGGGTNTLTGPNAAVTWNVTAQNAGSLTSGSSTNFADMQNLTGGTGADTFVFSDGVGVDGTINGGDGTNTLDESAYTTAVTIDLSAHTATGVGGGFANVQTFVGPGASGTLHGPNAPTTWNVTATDAGNLTGGFGFTGFGNLTGGSAADDFVFSDGAAADGILDGGGGANAVDLSAYSSPVTVDLTADVATGDAGFVNVQSFTGSAGGGNTLNGPAANATWNLGGRNAGTLTGGFSFSLLQNLNGGAGNNTFVFANGATVDGAIAGGGGTNALDYSAYTTYVIVNLQTATATGAGGVANIQNVTGGNGGPAGSYNLLVGNGGNVLTGGNGRRNLLIAGGAASRLVGGDGEDLLIAGTTDYDTNAPALTTIAAVWAGSRPYQDRVNQLLDPNYLFPLNSGTVHSNGGGNTLTGKPGGSTALDLYYANVGAGDTTDRGTFDTVIRIS